MTVSNLRWTGAALMAAGILFAVGIAIHPADEFANFSSAAWAQAHWLVASAAILSLFGLTGLYVRWLGSQGALGVAAYVLSTIGFALVVFAALLEGAVVPPIAASAQGAETLLSMDGPVFSGSFGLVFLSLLATFGLGGLLLGWTLYQGKLGAPYGALLWAVGAPLFAVGIMTEQQLLMTIFGVLTGAGMLWVGYSLWSAESAAAAAGAPATP